MRIACSQHGQERPQQRCDALAPPHPHPQKVFQALEAGCLPLYLGAPNAGSFLPDAAAAIDVASFLSMGELAAELGRLAADRAAYEERLAWKARPPDAWQPSEMRGMQARLHGMPRAACQQR